MRIPLLSLLVLGLACHAGSVAASSAPEAYVDQDAAPTAPPDLLGTLTSASDADLERQVSELVAAALQAKGLFLRQPVVRVGALAWPIHGQTVQLRWVARPDTNTGLAMPLLLSLEPLGMAQAAVPVRIFGRLQRDTLVAERDLRRGDSLRCSDTRVERRDMTTSNPSTAPRIPCSLPDGSTLRRALSQGDELRTGDFGTKPAVAGMSRVSVQAVVGAVVLRTPGIALSDAALGEPVRVRPNGSAQTLWARVIGPQSVAVEEGAQP